MDAPDTERKLMQLDQSLAMLLANGLDALLVGRNISMVSVGHNALTVDPLTPKDGTVWYRSDLNAFRLRINSTTYSLVAGSVNTVANDTIWDAKGDLAVGTAADTAAKLTVGANTTILMADSTQTTGLKWQATPAVRTISLPFTGADNARTGARVVTAYDAHGTFTQYGPHVDNTDADASYKQLRWSAIHVPADFSSAMTLKFFYSSSVASNNAVFACGAREALTAATAHTTSLNEGSNGLLTLACPGTADTIATGSIAFDVAPVAGRSLQVGIDINTNHANDSNTGTKTLWDVWLEYVPTL